MSLDAASPQINASVFASAGSGKTWLLVTRIIRTLLEGARPDGILAVTFTRKAAGEMRARLNERLREWVALDESALGEALAQIGLNADEDTLARARGLYERLLFAERAVRASTFHALCQDILRRFPMEADIPPGFELAQSTTELRNQAWEALFAEATLAPEAPLAQALETLFELCNGLDGTRGALDSFLEHRGDWWAFTETEAKPVQHAGQRLLELLDIDPDADPLAGFLSPERRDRLVRFHELLSRHPTQKNQAHADALAAVLEQTGLGADAFEMIRDVFLTNKDQPRARKSSKTQAAKMTAQGEESFLELHAQLCEAVLDTLDHYAQARSYRLNQAWYTSGERYLYHYQRLKEELRTLDFNDLEWRAYTLLNHADNALWVQYKLDQRIDHLLIDEFQDTNPTQWRLLLPLLEELAAGEGERSRSVFLVGDTKQSIYGFRRAKPELQGAAATWLQDHLQARAYHLDKSWRSSPAVIDFVNQVFGSGPLSDMNGGFPRHDTHLRGLWGRVEVLTLIEPPPPPEPLARETLRNPLHEPRVLPEDPSHYLEGQAIAARIQSLVQGGTVIGAEDNARALRYGDVMILIRSRTHAQALERALREAQVPFLGAEQGTLLESLEVQDLVALLEILMTPYNNLTLAQVLRSPLFAASDADLVRLACTQGGDWMNRLDELAPTLPANSPLLRAREKLGQWHALAGHIPIHDLLDHIYADGDVLGRYQASAREDQVPGVTANLMHFLELALEVDSGRYPSLVHFLARLRSLRAGAEEAPDAPPVAGAQSRVHIMTVHAAKGLEAPVVFLADAASAVKSRHAFEALVDWPAEAAQPRHIMLLGRRAELDRRSTHALEQALQAERREQANLLYVALTRARQLLFISGCRGARSQDLGWYAQVTAPLEGFAEALDDGGWRYEWGTPPRVRGRDETPEAPLAELPAALSAPVRVPRRDVEIAPSHGVAQGGMTTEQDDDGLARGIAIHRFLECLNEDPALAHDALLHRSAAELGLGAHHPELPVWLAEAERVLATPELQTLFSPGPQARALNEVPISYTDRGQRVHGVIDRLIIEPGRIRIIDYKTHRVSTESARQGLAQRYRHQMLLYRQGVQALWPERPIETYLLFTHTARLYPMDA